MALGRGAAPLRSEWYTPARGGQHSGIDTFFRVVRWAYPANTDERTAVRQFFFGTLPVAPPTPGDSRGFFMYP